MAVTREDAERMLAAAVGVRAPDDARLLVSRVVICQAVLTYCQGWCLEPLRWDTPLGKVTGQDGDPANATYRLLDHLFWDMDLEQLQWEEEWERIATAETFGDLVLLVEARVRAFWNPDAVTGCKTQALFYRMRRLLALQPGARNCKPDPRRRLDEILPGPDAEAFCQKLTQRFGARDIPRTGKLFGILPPGATWLVFWITSLFVGFGFLEHYAGLWFFAYLIVSCFGIGLLLLALARPSWDSELTRRTLKHNAEAATNIRATFAAWAP